MSFCAGFHHAALQVRDVERVAGFYRDVLGLPELERHRHPDGALRSIWLGMGAGGEEAGFIAVEADPSGAPPALGWSMVALRISPADKPALEAHLAARGVAIERRTGFTLYVRDPEGNLVGLSHYPNPA